MNEVNKKFSYKGSIFNINVKFNTRVERRINSNRFHTITVSSNRFYTINGQENKLYTQEVNDKSLESSITAIEKLVRKYIDKLPNINDRYRLLRFGFS